MDSKRTLEQALGVPDAVTAHNRRAITEAMAFKEGFDGIADPPLMLHEAEKFITNLLRVIPLAYDAGDLDHVIAGVTLLDGQKPPTMNALVRQIINRIPREFVPSREYNAAVAMAERVVEKFVAAARAHLSWDDDAVSSEERERKTDTSRS